MVSSALSTADEVEEPDEPTATPRGPRIAFVVIVLAYVVGCAVFIRRTVHRVDGRLTASLFDDAMISMRYAHHLAEGHGLVWNVGDSPIEGFTNPLWTLWMAVLHLLPVPLDVVPVLVMVSSLALLVANLFVVRAIARRLVPGHPWVHVGAVALVAAYYPLTYWSLRGMEVGLVALLIDLAILLALRIDAEPTRDDTRWLLVVFVALVLTRTDAALAALIVAGWLVVRAARAERLHRGLTLFGTIVGTVVALTVARKLYFGDFLPNTYYLKLTGVGLSTRLHVGMRDLAYITLIHFGPAVVLAYWGLRARVSAGVLLAGVFAGQAAYSAYVGGDAWEALDYANRYLCVAAPCLLLLTAVGIHHLIAGPAETRTRRLAGTAVALGALALAVRQWGRPADPFLTPGFVDMRPWSARLVLLALVLGLVAVLARPVTRLCARRPVAALAVLVVAIVIAMNGPGVYEWWHHNAAYQPEDEAMLERGVLLRQATTPDATIAAWWAGNSPWSSDRTTFDVLGKSDRKIAREAPYTNVFRPGHNKRDLAYTIGELQPDVVDLGAFPALLPEEVAQIEAWGYEFLPGGAAVRRDSTNVDRDRLRAGLQATNPGD